MKLDSASNRIFSETTEHIKPSVFSLGPSPGPSNPITGRQPELRFSFIDRFTPDRNPPCLLNRHRLPRPFFAPNHT